MSNYKLTLEEQETIISYNAAEDTCNICTANTFDKDYYDKLCEERPEWIKCVKREQYYNYYECSKKTARIKPPQRISEETKKARAEALARHRSQTLGNVGKSK